MRQAGAMEIASVGFEPRSITIDYSTMAASATNYGYDRQGRLVAVTNGTQICTLSYNSAGQVLTESWSGAPLDNITVTNDYDSLLRRTNLTVLKLNNALVAQNMGYDINSRLQTVAEGANSASYGYFDDSALVSKVTFSRNGQVRMTTSKQYDLLNRLTSVNNVPAGGSPIAFSYAYNSANQRTRTSLGDGSYWAYGYDSLGQVTSGKKYWRDQTPVAGEQFEYTFDDIGNRTQTKAGGDAQGANLRVAAYQPNIANQYTGREVPGALDITGISFADSDVKVNSQTTYRKGEYFRKELSLDNTTDPVWANVNVTATGQAAESGKTFLPQTPEQFTHDGDGNLATDGRWAYTWDAQNRLLSMVANTKVGPQQKIDFTYDWRGRRISKVVSELDVPTGTYIATATNLFVYDGWNLVAELTGFNTTTPTMLRSYLWGLDLSGWSQGAGGVGGLLAISDQVTISGPSSHFVAYDGNGNVAALINAVDGTFSALYEYGPFGEVICATGPMAKANPFRFSSKYQDDETDFLYYGYRHFSASTGRWLSRDPIEEEGGPSLNAFVQNSPPNAFDQLGLVIVGFYGADLSYSSPNWGNELLEEASALLEENEKVLRPSGGGRDYRLYHSRAAGQAFADLLRYLDSNNDGYYDPPCDSEEPIKIFGWSWGGASAIQLANLIRGSENFKKKDIEVVAVIDPVTKFRTADHKVHENVHRLWNRYQRHGANVLPLGLPNHGRKLTITDPGKTKADQVQMDPNGQVPGLDHVSIVGLVLQDLIGQLWSY